MKKYLAIIPARGGSKRLLRKNVLPLQGRPLIEWTIESAIQSVYINDICVTSDDNEVLEIAKSTGCLTIKRPNYLASDTATTFDTVKHAIENLSESYEYIILLQPTSPLRKAKHIDEAIDLLNNKLADAIISVCEMEYSPLWANTLPSDDSMKNFLINKTLQRSQDLQKFYRLNGAIYICKTRKLKENKSFFLKENIFAYKMSRKYSIDIDEEIDFKIAEILI